MKRFRPESLVYHPECAWIVERPQVHFNKVLFCEGEPLKVLWRPPRFSWIDLRESLLLRVSNLDEEGELADTVLEKKLVADHWWPGLLQMVGTGPEEPLREGAYVAQVLPSERSSDEESDIYDEHQFQVVGRDEYWEQWRELFGEEWDDPIFWDEMKARPEAGIAQEEELEPEQGEELMRGLPVQGILSALPEEVVWDAETILQLLGPTMSAFMSDERGRLPFYTTFSLDPSSRSIPHIDLTKVMWLLSVIGPACRDLGFIAVRSHISVTTNEETLYLRISYDNLRRYPYPEGLLLNTEKLEATDAAPEIFRVVEETAGKYFQFKLDAGQDEVGIYFY
jgi:hypothetical protein